MYGTILSSPVIPYETASWVSGRGLKKKCSCLDIMLSLSFHMVVSASRLSLTGAKLTATDVCGKIYYILVT